MGIHREAQALIPQAEKRLAECYVNHRRAIADWSASPQSRWCELRAKRAAQLLAEELAYLLELKETAGV